MKNENEFIINEFRAEDDSFLIKLRIEFLWDHKRFVKILKAMKNICISCKSNDSLERQIAEGFWYFSNFVKSWSSHENFPRQYRIEYYELAYELIFSFSDWYFTGNSPFNRQSNFDDKIRKLNKLI